MQVIMFYWMKWYLKRRGIKKYIILLQNLQSAFLIFLYKLTFTYGSLSLPTFLAQNPAQLTKCLHLTVPYVVSTASIWPFWLITFVTAQFSYTCTPEIRKKKIMIFIGNLILIWIFNFN